MSLVLSLAITKRGLCTQQLTASICTFPSNFNFYVVKKKDGPALTLVLCAVQNLNLIASKLEINVMC